MSTTRIAMSHIEEPRTRKLLEGEGEKGGERERERREGMEGERGGGGCEGKEEGESKEAESYFPSLD